MLLPGYVYKGMHDEFSLVFPVNLSVPETDCITGQFVLFIEYWKLFVAPGLKSR